MKLIRCHIENFGALSKRDFAFQDGLNVILEDNGAGKSTLAVFIKAMLFGLPKMTKRDIDINEREKYRPWQGGAYGGYLVFQVKERVYSVERFFGDKESEDTVRLIDMDGGKDSEDYDKTRLGQAIFGVDEAGYEKSTYYSQRDPVSVNPDSVYAKLTLLLEEDNDMGSYQQAQKILDEEEKIYRKNKGDDIITKTKTALQDARTNAENATRQEAILADKENQKKEVADSLAKLCNEHSDTKKDIYAAIKRAAYENYLGCKKSYEEALQKKTIAEASFMDNLPAEADLDTLSDKINALTLAQNRLVYLEKELASVQSEQELINSGATPEQRELAALQAFFKGNPPTEDELEGGVTLYANSNALTAQLSNQDTVKKVGLKNVLIKRKIPFIALVAAALTLTAGIITVFFSLIVGISLIAAGGLSAITGVIVVLYFALKEKGLAAKVIDDGRLQLIAERNSASDGVSAFLEKYGHNADNPSLAFMDIRQKSNDYRRLLTKIASDTSLLINKSDSTRTDKKNTENTLSALIKEISDFLHQCGGGNETDYKEGLKAVRSRLGEYNKLAALASDAKRKLEVCPKPEEENEENSDKVYNMEELVAKEKRLTESIDEMKMKLKSLETNIVSLTEIAALKQDYEAEEKNLELQLKKYEADRKILKKTRELMEDAKNNLTKKYLVKMKEAFERYAGIVLGKAPDLIFNTDFGYEIIECGRGREPKSFSRGYRDLYDVCAHLSLADALYKNEKPFLILDDPFKNLDDHKMNSAKKLIEALKEEYQIIYLICHTSRQLEGII